MSLTEWFRRLCWWFRDRAQLIAQLRSAEKAHSDLLTDHIILGLQVEGLKAQARDLKLRNAELVEETKAKDVAIDRVGRQLAGMTGDYRAVNAELTSLQTAFGQLRTTATRLARQVPSVLAMGDRADLHNLAQEKRYDDGLGD